MAVPRASRGVAAAGLVAGLPLIPIGLSSDDVEPRGIWAVFGPLIKCRTVSSTAKTSGVATINRWRAGVESMRSASPAGGGGRPLTLRRLEMLRSGVWSGRDGRAQRGGA
jgi:hypothetical protein